MKKDFSLVVWSVETGHFLKAWAKAMEFDKEAIAKEFEAAHSLYRAIHIFEGSVHPQSYRSLPVLLESVS
jgi:hypothetical protein